MFRFIVLVSFSEHNLLHNYALFKLKRNFISTGDINWLLLLQQKVDNYSRNIIMPHFQKKTMQVFSMMLLNNNVEVGDETRIERHRLRPEGKKTLIWFTWNA